MRQSAPPAQRRELLGLLAPLRVRSVRLLWLAKLASEVGDWAGRLALAILVYEQSRSPLATAAVTAVSLAPWLGLGQVLTAVTERYAHRSVMVCADLLRLLCFAVLALVHLPVGVLLAVAFLAAAATPPFEGARAAVLPAACGLDATASPARDDGAAERLYGQALRLFNATFQTGLLVGYAAGGLLVALISTRGALLVDAATFAVSAALVAGLPGSRRPAGDTGPGTDAASLAPAPTARARLATACRVLRQDRLLGWSVLLMVGAAAACMAAESLLVVFCTAYAGGAPVSTGLVSAVVPLGALLATPLLPGSGEHAGLVRLSAVVTVAGAGASGALLLLVPDLWTGLLVFAVLGGLSVLTIPLGAVLGARLPRENRATCFSVVQGALMVAQAGAAAVSGALADVVPVATAIALLCLPALVLGVAGLVGAPVRRLLPDPEDNTQVVAGTSPG
ncbi:MAG TPA: MFS transporter [Motilibacteraceae bacterium]|nr:MFS transporter [Motilibacteraceae bacterium]